jgi:hypothetical protein
MEIPAHGFGEMIHVTLLYLVVDRNFFGAHITQTPEALILMRVSIGNI